MGEFGLQVIESTDWLGQGKGFKKRGNWHVYLPHQCDEWDIAGESNDGVTHEEAINKLTAFIAEATEALSSLVEKREINNG